MQFFIEAVESVPVIIPRRLSLLRKVEPQPSQDIVVDALSQVNDYRAFQVFTDELGLLDSFDRNRSDKTTDLREHIDEPVFGKPDE